MYDYLLYTKTIEIYRHNHVRIILFFTRSSSKQIKYWELLNIAL